MRTKPERVLLPLLLVFLLQACSPAEGLTPDRPAAPPLPENLAVTYLEDAEDFRNPERGFHFDYDLVSGSHPWLAEPAWLSGPDAARYGAADGPVSLARSYVRLDDWRDRDLPASLLTDLERGFAQLREYGYKVVLRFTYNFPSRRAPATADAPLPRVLRHIEQLTPVLNDNADVIYAVQAGFIGQWGEWHNSENGLDTEEGKRAVASALLAALPGSRMIQIRTPRYVRHVLDSEIPFTPDDAFTGSPRSRIGFVNDCFLAGPHDQGTYHSESDRAYAEALGPYTVTGGETCENDLGHSSAQHTCAHALTELGRYHWDYLNLHYAAPVLARLADDGCFPEIARRLGYRYELLGAEAAPAEGGEWQLRLLLSNTGFGNLYNRRPLELHLAGGSGTHVITLLDDVRGVLPAAGTKEQLLVFPFTLPAGLAAGTWELELALPDASERLAGRPEYALRLAGHDPDTAEPLWDPLTGRHRLGLRLSLPAD